MPIFSERFTPRFSLRTLIIFSAVVSVACIALKHAGPTWWLILSSVSLLVFMAVAVVALVGQGKQWAFAIGAVTCFVIYGSLLFAGGADELDPYKGQLPTTKALQPLFRLVVTGRWIDLMTGKEIPNYKPPAPSSSGGEGGFGMSGEGGFGGGMAVGGMVGGGMQQATFLETPTREQFWVVGHLLWADLLAWIGGLFACFVYAQRSEVKK